MTFLVVVFDARREMIFFEMIFLVVVLEVALCSRFLSLSFLTLVAESITHLIADSLSLHFVTSEYDKG